MRGGEQRAIIMHYYPILKALLMLVEEALKCPRVISPTSDNKVKPKTSLQTAIGSTTNEPIVACSFQ